MAERPIPEISVELAMLAPQIETLVEQVMKNYRARCARDGFHVEWNRKAAKHVVAELSSVLENYCQKWRMNDITRGLGAGATYLKSPAHTQVVKAEE